MGIAVFPRRLGVTFPGEQIDRQSALCQGLLLADFMDGTTGTYWTDKVRNQNSLVISAGGGLSFSGASWGSTLSGNGSGNVRWNDLDYLTVNENDFSLSCWLTFTGSSFECALAWRSQGGTALQCIVTVNRVVTGDIELETWAWNDATTRVSSGAGFNDGKYHHVAGVYSAASNILSIYVDGLFRASASQGAYSFGTGNCGLVVGSNIANIQQLTGGMGPYAIWNRALQPAEIQQLYVDPLALAESLSTLRLGTIALPASVGNARSFAVIVG